MWLESFVKSLATVAISTSRGKKNNKHTIAGDSVAGEFFGHLDIWIAPYMVNISFGDQKVPNGPQRKIYKKNKIKQASKFKDFVIANSDIKSSKIHVTER